ncbi:MAG: hypothetical protein PV362_11275 [Providencia heimbachae]|nr:hypothetical protein [Providencia heimbachae]
MQIKSNEPIITVSVPMSQDDVEVWIRQMNSEYEKLDKLKAEQDKLEQDKAELQRKIEKLDDEIFDQQERCKVTISA